MRFKRGLTIIPDFIIKKLVVNACFFALVILQDIISCKITRVITNAT
jgi:hypothetical protein